MVSDKDFRFHNEFGYRGLEPSNLSYKVNLPMLLPRKREVS
jgi:hypothetical protein